MKKDFWDSWKNKTNIEKKAIRVIKLAKERIIKSVPKKALFSIYIKGSFVRREMNKKSDVDIVPIITENKYQGAIFEVNSKEIAPAIVVPLSLEEFKKNKLFTKSHRLIDLRAKPDSLLSKLNECKLIYGKKLNPKKFKIRSRSKALKEEIKVIEKGYIPYYKINNIQFEPLLKEVFWLVELELINKGIKVKGSFIDLARAVKDKSHIIHEAIKLRNYKKITKTQKTKFLTKLKLYLKNLK